MNDYNCILHAGLKRIEKVTRCMHAMQRNMWDDYGHQLQDRHVEGMSEDKKHGNSTSVVPALLQYND